jgi:hypothetical protein
MKTQGEHIRTLRRRVDFLKARDYRNSYDQAELGALEWALVNLPPAQPAPVQEPVAWMHKETGLLRQANKAKGGDFEPNHWTPVYATPPTAPVLEGRDWSLLEATQESLREHIAEIKRLKEAQPAVPDAMTSADIQEHIEYVAGWNDCRAAMLEILKARGNT